jgi:NADH:ubiquinone oxidoreductase subunit E
MDKAKVAAQADPARVEAIIAEYQNQRWALIPLLQRIQQEFGFIPPSSIGPIAKALGIFPVQVQAIITFYAQLYTAPRGKNIVRVCRGTACHVRGGKTILKLVKRHLGIDEGETTPDFEYSLETVACIGVCAIAPNMVINDVTYGHMNPKKISQLFSEKVKT